MAAFVSPAFSHRRSSPPPALERERDTHPAQRTPSPNCSKRQPPQPPTTSEFGVNPSHGSPRHRRGGGSGVVAATWWFSSAASAEAFSGAPRLQPALTTPTSAPSPPRRRQWRQCSRRGADGGCSRRWRRKPRTVRYSALDANKVPCNKRGQTYYQNCASQQAANPYRRGCSAITRCSRNMN